MKKLIVLLVLASAISCGLTNRIEPEYILPENADELLLGKWLLTTLDGTDASQDEIVMEFRTDSTYWTYSLLDSASVALATAGSIADSISYVTWFLDMEAQLIRKTSYSAIYFLGEGWGYMEWELANYGINLITKEKLVLKQTVGYVGFDPFYGSGSGSTHRAEETYVKIP